jgi:hypothetical protein
MIEKAEGLAIHGLERETSPERAELQKVFYYKDTSCNDEINEGFIDLQDELGSNSSVGFWLDAAEEGIGASLRLVQVLRRSEDGQSFECGVVEAIGLNEDGEPEYGIPKLLDDIPAELVEAHLLGKPLFIRAQNNLFGDMTVAKVGVYRRYEGHYDQGHWGENPIEKIITAQQIVRTTK